MRFRSIASLQSRKVLLGSLDVKSGRLCESIIRRMVLSPAVEGGDYRGQGDAHRGERVDKALLEVAHQFTS